MNNEILCSTGAYIGYENNYDPDLIPVYGSKIKCDAFEFMVVSTWDEFPDKITGRLCNSPLVFRTLHSDKDIGKRLSDHDSEGAFSLFLQSLKSAVNVGAEKMVLHLWGGMNSDCDIEYNIEEAGKMLSACLESGITLCIENVPCRCGDPIEHWRRLAVRYPEIRFVFDSRFAAFADEIDKAGDIFTEPELSGRIVHMHISDFVGPSHDFKKLRPIPQPGRGIIDFDKLFSVLSPIYNGTVTLESPSLYEFGKVDTEELNNSLDYIRRGMNGIVMQKSEKGN